MVDTCSVDSLSLISQSLIGKDGKDPGPMIGVDHIPLDGVLMRRDENMEIVTRGLAGTEQDSWYAVPSQAAPRTQ